MPASIQVKAKKTIESLDIAYFGIFLIVLALVIIVRIRLLSIPFERDEGEYAYIAQQFLQGIMPFAETHNMKMPGIYFIYAGIMAVFGQTVAGVHAGLLCANVVTIVSMVILGRALFSNAVGFAAGSIYAVLSLSESVVGVFAHAEHFVMLLAIPSMILLYKGFIQQKIVLIAVGGFFAGLSFCILQHGMFFIFFGTLFLVVHFFLAPSDKKSKILKATAIFVSCAILPIAILFLVLYAAGVFKEFWFWTFTYAKEYVLMRSLSDGYKTFKMAFLPMIHSMFLPWLGALVGALYLFAAKGRGSRKLFVGGLFVFSCCALLPGLYFRDHYFVFVMPAIALLCGIGIHAISKAFQNVKTRFVNFLPPIILGVLAFSLIFIERDHLFKTDPVKLCKTLYTPNPFAESVVLAQYIQKVTLPTDRIAVVGSEPQIYFYSNRKSATSFMYTYPLMENHPYAAQLQAQMINQIETAKPKVLILIRNPLSWLSTPQSNTRIFYWFSRYSQEHYMDIAYADQITPDSTRYVYAPESNGYQPSSEFGVQVLYRID